MFAGFKKDTWYAGTEQQYRNQEKDAFRHPAERRPSSWELPYEYVCWKNIMTDIEDGKTLYMAENKLVKGAYIAICLLDSASRFACQRLTKDICDILQDDFGVDGANVYMTYHSIDLCGWNCSMF